MSASNIAPILHDALARGYALGAYNVYALCQAEALIGIHQEYRSPLVIQVADPANGFLGGGVDFMHASTAQKRLGAQRIGSHVRELSQKADIPVCLHLDHGKSLEAVVNAIGAGFTSVMYDGSHLPLEENIENTKQVVQYAHERGVSVEAELGILGGVEDDVIADASRYTDPGQAMRFVQETGVDCLAISYGTSHGANKGKNARLRADIVRSTMAVFSANSITCSLVSHGSSNVPQDIVEGINELGGNIQNAHGISLEQLRAVIPQGICKINVDTDIRLATTLHFRQYLSGESEILSPGLQEVKSFLDHNPSCFDPRVYLVPVMDKIIRPIQKDADLSIIEELMTQAVRDICRRTIPAFGSEGTLGEGDSL